MDKHQHMAIGEAISELCNPDAHIGERLAIANLVRKAFGLPTEHTAECAANDPDLEPEDAAHECNCGYWDAIYPADATSADFQKLNG